MTAQLSEKETDRLNSIKDAMKEKGVDFQDHDLLISFSNQYGLGYEKEINERISERYFVDDKGDLIVVTEGKIR